MPRSTTSVAAAITLSGLTVTGLTACGDILRTNQEQCAHYKVYITHQIEALKKAVTASEDHLAQLNADPASMTKGNSQDYFTATANAKYILLNRTNGHDIFVISRLACEKASEKTVSK